MSATLTVETVPAITYPKEKVTPLLPSEALRLGRLTVPKRAIGAMVKGPNHACALAAIHIGYGAVVEQLFWGQYDLGGNDAFSTPKTPKIVRGRRAVSPCHCEDYRGYKMPVLDVVPHLNDDHRWSDDKIVAWLQSIGL